VDDFDISVTEPSNSLAPVNIVSYKNEKIEGVAFTNKCFLFISSQYISAQMLEKIHKS
jgi:hypothetical protein